MTLLHAGCSSVALPRPRSSSGVRRIAFFLAVAAGLSLPPAMAQIQGYGVAATGGAGGSVCTVTTSAESGAGSFDSCVARGGNQTIQFAVALAKVPTTQYLESNTTIDGCANGMSGVTLDQPGDTGRGVVLEGPVSNVIVRCIRFQGTGKKPGYTTEFDLLGLDGGSGVVSRVAVDRCTFTGATDGALDITGDVVDVTVQRTLYYGNALNQLIKYDSRQRISLHHNVYTANGERNPQIKGDARNIDFVSNVIHNNTMTTDAAGNGYSPYGTRLWNAASGSDSPGNITGNFVANAWIGTNASLEIDTESGASAAGIYLSGNYCSPGTCRTSPASSPLAVPTANVVTVTSPGCMASQMLPTVGAPNRTTTDQTRLSAVATALPTGCSSSGIGRIWYLRNSNTPGSPDVAASYGAPGDIPVVGDWDGDGVDTIGVYRPSHGAWYLRNSNTPGSPAIAVSYGGSGDIPVVGDWDGDGVDTIGVYRPSEGAWYLRNSNTPGSPDVAISYGTAGSDMPVVGDWDGDGVDTIGVFRPSHGAWYLRNSNTPGSPDVAVSYGASGDIPVVGDWDGDGVDTIGVFRPSHGAWYLRNSLTSGSPDIALSYGSSADIPVVGDWNSDGIQTLGVCRLF